MILGLVTLLTALCISGIAAFYSIVGLTAIFAAAYWPIVVMGGVLEMGKVVTTLWLHYNWERAEWKIKSYLVTAVGVLMLITSMGIFGFLSKAHLEQAVPSGDIQAQVSLFDEKIKTQRDNIDSARKALVQLDSAVDQTMARTTDDTGATKSANLRRSQQRERARLQTDIDGAQKQITILQEQRAPIASQFRKVEAEVGPIKYIAALIYGDKADQNMLEAAVRWVIIIIVFVFDPLAIVLILAATTSIDWSKLDRRKNKQEKLEEAKEEARMQSELEESLADLKRHEEQKQTEQDIVELLENAKELTKAECAIEFEKVRLADAEYFESRLQHSLHVTSEELHEKTIDQLHREEEVAEVATILAKMTDQVNDLTSYINELEEDVSTTLYREGSLQIDLKTMIDEYDVLLDQKQLLDESFKQAQTELQSFDEVIRQMGVLQELLDKKDIEIGKLKAMVEEDHESIKNILLKKEEELTHLQGHIHTTLDAKNTQIESLKLAVKQEQTSATERLQIKDDEIRELQSVLLQTATVKDEEIAILANKLANKEIAMADALTTLQEPLPAEFNKVLHDNLWELYEETPIELPPDIMDEKDVPEASPMPLPVRRNIEIPNLNAISDNFPLGGNASFGINFPNNPVKGDLFLRVDYMPSKLFKWSDSRWIEVDKSNTDTFAYDQEYIKLLVQKISSGEYDIDELSVTEQEQVAQYLKQNPNT